MRELELLADYLIRVRQERLLLAHSLALSTDPRILAIKAHAHEAEMCERILKATRVDGIYDADPEKVPGARMFDRITYMDVIQKGLKVMDSTAISLCMDNKMPIFVFNLNVPGNIKRVVLGEKIGSTVCAG